MSRETLKDFLSKIGKEGVGKVSYVIDTSENVGKQDLGVDPNTGLPIIETLSSLSGDYVKFLTEESKNLHSFKSGNNLNSSYKRADHITLSDQSSVKNPFNPPNESINYTNSDYLGNNQKLSQFVDKIGSSHMF